MTDTDSYIQFTTPEDFNDKASYICDNPYDEYMKFKNYFTLYFKQNGHNCFAPTMAVFNANKEFVGMVTCREAKDKDDLFIALAEMLYLPLSISSDLFIISTDVNIRQNNDNYGEAQDAMTVSYVTPDHCLIFTSPYTYDQDNNVTFHEDKSFITKVSSDQATSPVGNLIELFYVFSHTDTSGPFQHEEVLSYFDTAGFQYEIFHPENLKGKPFVALPFKM